MKNQKKISQLENHKINTSLITKINGGEKKEAARAVEELE